MHVDAYGCWNTTSPQSEVGVRTCVAEPGLLLLLSMLLAVRQAFTALTGRAPRERLGLYRLYTCTCRLFVPTHSLGGTRSFN